MKKDERFATAAGDRLHGPRPDAARGDAAEEVRRDDHRQGRPLARAAARRDRALPAPRRGEAAAPRSGACSSSCTRADEVFKGKKVLIVDDDVRNVFALTSVLERHGMEVRLRGERQRGDRDAPGATRTIDLVLMDIMMPELDGYETMRSIREEPRFQQAADHLADREGDEGRPREVDHGRRVRLHHEAGRHRPAPLADAGVAVQLDP